MIQIFTDTTANLPAELIRRYHLRVIPLTYSLNGVEAKQDPEEDFDGKAYYDAMRKGGKVKTAMISMGAFLDPMRECLASGNDVLYVGLSGGISGTVRAAAGALAELREEFPERKTAAIDTFAASLGEGLLVLEAARMAENGTSFDEIVPTIETKRNTMCQYFTVDDLEYLKRGGRISRAVALVGTVLNIKPLLTGDAEGKIVMCGKVRGRKQALMTLVKNYDKLAEDRSAAIGIAHADAPEDAAFVLEQLRQKGFTGQCISVCYEPVTGSHVGPGTVALFFPGIHK